MINLNIDWGRAILVVVLGLATVFAVLIIIMLAIVIMSKIFAPKNAKPKKDTAPSITNTPAPKAVEITQNEDDTELIAVIAAAIAASLNTSVNNLKIKSYKRLGTSNSAWANASRRENIYK